MCELFKGLLGKIESNADSCLVVSDQTHIFYTLQNKRASNTTAAAARYLK
jgi:hypothetical protein